MEDVVQLLLSAPMAGQHGGSGLDHQTNLEQILEANLDRFQLGQANILTDGGPWCYKGAQPPPYLHIALSGQETHRPPGQWCG